MATVAETIQAIDLAQRQRAVRRDRADKYALFYKSRLWRAVSYRYRASQPKPLRCQCCGTDSRQTRIITDHLVPIKTEEGWRQRLTGPFQLLCNDCNLAKASSDQTDWRPGADAASSPSIVREESRRIHG